MQIYSHIGAFYLNLVPSYIIAPPSKESCPGLQGIYAKMLNASAILAKHYSTQHQHCILKYKTIEDMEESANKK